MSGWMLGSIPPFTENPKTAFDELFVAELTPVVQIHSAYNINTRIMEARDNNGTSSIANNMFKVSTGGSANQGSSLLSRIAVKYNAGQGGLCRFTALYTTGVANSTAYAGIGTSSEGYFFGYNGATFGLLRRQGGSPEIRTLTINPGSSDAADSVTITLDGDTKAVTLNDDSGNATLTANTIAAADYSNTGLGWKAHAMGANIVFESYNAASKTGTYELTDALSAAGTFARSVVGVAPTETIVAQSAWSEDVMDGSGPSGVTLDQTKGNVYEIRYQWLGFGIIDSYIENPSNGKFILVHKNEYANANTIPSVDNPTLPLCLAVANTSNTSDIVLQAASMMGGIEGKDIGEGLFNAAVLETTSIGTTETPVLSLHNHTVFQSKINRVRMSLEGLGVSFEASVAKKPAVVRVRLNPTLTAASFSAVDANTSVARKDTSATAVSGGTLLFAQSIAEGAPLAIDLSKKTADLAPGETITVSLEASNGTIDPDVTLAWKDKF
ncbi:MAG TPA: hypothetical protein ENI27_05925 [bacterium]|nr:hypothetical protein [bacterium]